MESCKCGRLWGEVPGHLRVHACVHLQVEHLENICWLGTSFASTLQVSPDLVVCKAPGLLPAHVSC